MRATIAVLGLGEAGSLIASDLAAAGVTVRGYDPAPECSAPGIERCSSAMSATAHADVILSVNWSTHEDSCQNRVLAKLCGQLSKTHRRSKSRLARP